MDASTAINLTAIILSIISLCIVAWVIVWAIWDLFRNRGKLQDLKAQLGDDVREAQKRGRIG